MLHPYAIRPRHVRKVAAGVFSAALLIGALPAIASAACTPSPTSTPFAQFGDTAAYSLLPGGTFESGAPGWSLTNSAVASGNESYEVPGGGGSHSLAIQPTGVAVSPMLCIDTAEPSFRFFLRRTSGSWGVLNVVLRWKEANGTSHNTTVASLQTGTSWQPSPVLQLATTLPLTTSGSMISAQLVFEPEQYGGAWAIDDVYIDPHSR
jgi:hypothetical protein